MATIPRRAYAEMFGPTTGDRLRLADTNLVIEVEDDLTLKAAALQLGYVDAAEFDRIVDPRKMVAPYVAGK